MSTLFGLAETRKGATLSDCGRYRYDLWRDWADPATPGINLVNFVMLNPSTADADEDDPTIRRCIGFAKLWGYDGLAVTNLYAFRATDPRDLPCGAAGDPVGAGNDHAIEAWACAASLVVCAWGNHGAVGGRAASVVAAIRRMGKVPHALKLTGNGQPGHPLYLRADLRPFPMEDAR